jgi:hypothetical protein
LRDFDETLYKGRSHCEDVHISPIIFQGIMAPGLNIFFLKFFVFATPPKPFKGFD